MDLTIQRSRTPPPNNNEMLSKLLPEILDETVPSVDEVSMLKSLDEEDKVVETKIVVVEEEQVSLVSESGIRLCKARKWSVFQ